MVDIFLFKSSCLSINYVQALQTCKPYMASCSCALHTNSTLVCHVSSQLLKTNATVFPKWFSKCKCWKLLKTHKQWKLMQLLKTLSQIFCKCFSNCFPKVFLKTRREFRTAIFFSNLFLARCCLPIICITSYTGNFRFSDPKNNSKWQLEVCQNSRSLQVSLTSKLKTLCKNCTFVHFQVFFSSALAPSLTLGCACISANPSPSSVSEVCGTSCTFGATWLCDRSSIHALERIPRGQQSTLSSWKNHWDIQGIPSNALA